MNQETSKEMLERAILGNLIESECVRDESFERLEANMFDAGPPRFLFETLLKMYEGKTSIDLTTLIATLGEKIAAVGGIKFLTGLSEFAIGANQETYINELIEHHGRHQILSIAQHIPQVLEKTKSAGITADKAVIALQNITPDRPGFMTLHDVLNQSLTQDKRGNIRISRGNAHMTGFESLDRLIAGFHDSELYILAARPGVGKTSFALNVALNMAKQGKPVAIFSMEMSYSQLATRLLAQTARVSSMAIRDGFMTPEESNLLMNAKEEISDLPILINDRPRISMRHLSSALRVAKRQHEISLAVVDYLQLMTNPGKESRLQEISSISRELKCLAIELNMPILALSQLSRAIEQRESKRPYLSDLRESGSIEQDADVVMFIAPGQEEGNTIGVEIVVAKNRNGATGMVKMKFVRSETRFYSLDFENNF